MTATTESPHRTAVPAAAERRRPAPLVILFTAASLLGATLLFAVQPMVAKMLLPSYGGSPMVWNTSMLFFQAALLAGYAYAHWSQRRLGRRTQPLVQIALVLLPVAVLPIGLPAWAAAPESAPPAVWLLMVLAAMVGVPFAVLATTSPLIQRWYSWSELPRSHDPYFLFAASNTGSFVALLAYPLLIEPRADVTAQARWWAIGYMAFAALMVACAIVVRLAARRGVGTGEVGTGEEAAAEAAFAAERAETDAGGADTTGTDAERAAADVDRIGWARRLRWLGLAFVPSSLMLGVTTHISTDIAAVPLLWVVPLALYLVTFIVAFAGTAQRWLPLTVYLSGGLALLMPWVGGLSRVLPVAVGLVLSLLLLAAAGLAGHGLLAADRPSPRRLTEFYLLVAVGGALGGLFNGLLAPVVFNWVAEFPLVSASLGLFPLALGRRAGLAARLGRARQWVSAGVLLTVVPLTVLGVWLVPKVGWTPLMVMLVVCVWAFALVARPVFLAVTATAMVVVLFVYQTVIGGVRERTFFGSYEVKMSAERHTLSHGTTLHGYQLRKYPRAATSYYAQSGPLGDVFGLFQGRTDPVAAVGLGAGTVAAYGKAGQRFDIYEIDPEVVRIANNPRYFTYLRDCACDIRTIVGDGRLRLAEAPDGTYGVIVLDAFSSDAVPAHLLTREALRLYMRKLRPDGILAFHISNRHLDLAPMLGATARAEGLATRAALYRPPDGDPFALTTHWVAIARDEAVLRRLPERGARWEVIPPGGPVWTDTYSSLFEILKLG